MYKIINVLDRNRNPKTDDASRGRIGLIGTFQFIPIKDKYRALFYARKHKKFITSYVDEWVLTLKGSELLTENSIYVLEDWTDEA